jgi:putative transposase
MVHQLQARGLSRRRSCALCHISRSSLHYRPRLRRCLHDQQLAAQLREIARKHPRYGYRRAHALLCRSGTLVNVKRVHRLWRHERLSVLCRKPKRRRSDRKEMQPLVATRPNHVWTYDFVHDSCANGQRLKLMTLTDEFTRESLAIEGGTSIRGRGVVAVLARVIAERGAPAFLRSDNGPEFIAHAVQHWLRVRRVQTAYIEPGSPWQNAKGESFNGRLRDECLNLEWFRNVVEARVVIGAWQRHYNEERPHSSLVYQTPQEFRRTYERHHGGSEAQIWGTPPQSTHATLSA